MMRARAGAALVLGAMAALQGCGYTTSTALLPSHLRTIAIPVFVNTTTEYTLEQEITDAVIARFVADNHLRVVDERSANAVLRGRVTGYRNSVFGFSTTEEAQEYRVTISIEVTLKDQVKNREMWSEPNLVKTANYYVVDVPGRPARTELDGRKEAVDKIAEEIVNRSVEGW
ncbi:MAG TPA: LptE family protein [Candidatus Limnocylindria bacterium]|nr:LptE family protein [Candidatus Limnocylindria bacterium]